MCRCPLCDVTRENFLSSIFRTLATPSGAGEDEGRNILFSLPCSYLLAFFAAFIITFTWYLWYSPFYPIWRAFRATFRMRWQTDIAYKHSENQPGPACTYVYFILCNTTEFPLSKMVLLILICWNWTETGGRFFSSCFLTTAEEFLFSRHRTCTNIFGMRGEWSHFAA